MAREHGAATGVLERECAVVEEGVNGAALAGGGLRERKKRAMRISIERTILELVLERGYEAATIEEVCSRAGISKKTFFNYYATKEAAIRGDAMALPSGEELAAALEGKAPGENYLDTIAELLAPSGSSAGCDAEVARLRDEVLSTMPQLLYQGHREVAQLLERLSEILVDYLVRHPGSRLVLGCSVADEAAAAASSAVSMARVRSVVSARRKEPVSLDEVRRLLTACLCAGDERA